MTGKKFATHVANLLVENGVQLFPLQSPKRPIQNISTCHSFRILAVWAPSYACSTSNTNLLQWLTEKIEKYCLLFREFGVNLSSMVKMVAIFALSLWVAEILNRIISRLNVQLHQHLIITVSYQLLAQK